MRGAPDTKTIRRLVIADAHFRIGGKSNCGGEGDPFANLAQYGALAQGSGAAKRMPATAE